VFILPDPEQKSASKGHRPPKSYRNPIFLAWEWQRNLDNGDCPSKAALASKLEVSRARVTQVLRLLRLDRQVLEAIAGLGDPLPSPIVTERRLRPIVGLPREEQRQRITALLADEARVLC